MCRADVDDTLPHTVWRFLRLEVRATRTPQHARQQVFAEDRTSEQLAVVRTEVSLAPVAADRIDFSSKTLGDDPQFRLLDPHEIRNGSIGDLLAPPRVTLLGLAVFDNSAIDRALQHRADRAVVPSVRSAALRPRSRDVLFVEKMRDMTAAVARCSEFEDAADDRGLGCVDPSLHVAAD